MGFFRHKPKPAKHLKRLIVGFIIGAAISSIIGKKLTGDQDLDKENELDEKED